MTAQHTPGPWTIQPGHNGIDALDTLHDCTGRHFANLRSVRSDSITIAGDRALIAAAPALLAALEDILEGGSWQDDGSFVYYPPTDTEDDEGAIGEAGAAIAQARGTPTAA